MPFKFPFFWQMKGLVSSLETLPLSRDVPRKDDVARAVGRAEPGPHPLLVAELADGKIIGDLRLATTRNDLVIGDLQTIFGSDNQLNHYALNRRRFRLPKRRTGTALLLGTANSDNYYHWLLDSLPRWRMLQAAGWQDYDFVLLHSLPRRFQEETLDWLGVPAAKRLRCSKNFIHQFHRLIVPAMPFPMEQVAPWVCQWLRSLVAAKASGPERIYLSRRGAETRRLVNEDELRGALALRGFVTFQAEKLSVAEQAQLLSSARMVVAPHGAALTNLVFAPPGAWLLELFHPTHKNRCYVNLAAVCGHQYASLDGEAVPGGCPQRLEYTVDVPVVTRMVDQNLHG
jgi:capsular polysaccharide biosynthesis protein